MISKGVTSCEQNVILGNNGGVQSCSEAHVKSELVEGENLERLGVDDCRKAREQSDLA